MAAELARRFTSAPLPPAGDTIVDLISLSRVSEADGSALTFMAGIYSASQWSAAMRWPPLIVTIADREGDGCLVSYREGKEGEQSSPVRIGPGIGDELGDGGPWMAIFAAVIGAADVVDEDGRRAVLDAIDATGSSPTGIRALATLVLRAAAARAATQRDVDRALRRSIGFILYDDAYLSGYADGLQRGRKESAIIMTLTERGISLTDRQRELISSCADKDRLARWFSRAMTAASASDVLRG
ncbi:MAG: hypothetical protein J2P28_04240 [Actinobacteria bacterium]|nr:hypothetical protein [Actinomycetota bacterium]